MRVEVAAPAISGDTVHFRWTQSCPNPFQHENAFFFRYEDLDLNQFSSSLFYELFLGLQLRVFAFSQQPLEIIFPEPLPRPTVEYWKAYHNADLVTIEPIAEVASYSPWSSSPLPEESRRSAGIFFGGGKDSMLAACLMSEIYGADQVVLFQCVHPFLRGPVQMNRLSRHLEQVTLQPARAALGIATQRAWTDYVAQLRVVGTRRFARPHLELYSVGFLPALLASGVSVCMPGLERTAFRFTTTANGERSFRYPKSRPEMLATQSRHYQRALGVDLSVTNINLLFTSLMAFRLLVERYPHAVRHVSMCNLGPGVQRWCYQCSKCAEYAFYTLGCDAIDPGFDYDRLFTRSRFVARLTAYLESGVELSVFGNAPWQPFLCNAGHYLGVCTVIARIDPASIEGRLSRKAYANLTIAKTLFGHAQFPGVEMLSSKSVDLLGTDLARAVARIAAEHFPVVDDLPGPWLAGNDEVSYDFSLRMPTRTGLLNHIHGQDR